MRISVILPTYNEQETLSLLFKRLVNVTTQLPAYDFEFIFVDDCSSDETQAILAKLKSEDKGVHIIRFARNCGSHAAVEAGLHYCRGAAAIVMATDLQDPPEIIPRLIEQWQKGFKTVWGVRQKRKGESFLTLALSWTTYFLMNRLTDVIQPPTGADVVLMDRAVIEAFKSSPEKNADIFMRIAWLGFTQSNITYVKEARHAGYSKWTFSKKIKVFFDALIPFSFIPIRLMSLMGAVFASLGLICGAIVITNKLLGHIDIGGWASLMIVVLLLGGFQMSMIGMLGEYLWRTYDETRGRPKYVIEKNTITEESSSSSEIRTIHK
jgi:polyisoprenyl-phosphate glycosyltransferase